MSPRHPRPAPPPPPPDPTYRRLQAAEAALYAVIESPQRRLGRGDKTLLRSALSCVGDALDDLIVLDVPAARLQVAPGPRGDDPGPALDTCPAVPAAQFACRRCDDSGWTLGDDGVMAPCPRCSALVVVDPGDEEIVEAAAHPAIRDDARDNAPESNGVHVGEVS